MLRNDKIVVGGTAFPRVPPPLHHCSYRFRDITGCAVAACSTVVTMTSKVNGKTQTLTPYRSETPKHIEMKIGMNDYVIDPYNHADFRYLCGTLVSYSAVGARDEGSNPTRDLLKIFLSCLFFDGTHCLFSKVGLTVSLSIYFTLHRNL